jgi:tetratricopeptide (TPR) repeat protein
VLGFAVLASLAWSHADGPSPAENAARVVSVGALWALAAIAVGASVGFLFGVPRNTATATVRPSAGPALELAENAAPMAKTNLEEIADWLSKLLVGGTLFSSGQLIKYLGEAGNTFATTITGQASPPGTAGPWSGVGSASIIYFGLIGLFGGYFLTRLYLIGALRRADEGDRPVVAERSGLTAAQLAALDAASLSVEGAGAEFDPIAAEAAEKIIAISLESLSNWRDVRLWAKAQLNKGDLDSAIKAYQKAIEIVPNDAETRLGYAVALSKKKSARRLILNQLEAAHGSLMLNSPRDLRKNVYKSLIHVWLYLKKPESFLHALRYAREYLAQPGTVHSGGLWVNIACAYGQCYSWIEEDPSRKVTSGAEISVRDIVSSEFLADSKRAELLEWIAGQALLAVRNAISRDEAWKPRLRELMGVDPRPPEFKDDDDLEPFASRAGFRHVVDAPSLPPVDPPTAG